MVELEKEDIFESPVQWQKIIEELDSFFPTFIPTPNNTIEDIMFRSGQRSVVEYIKTLLEN